LKSNFSGLTYLDGNEERKESFKNFLRFFKKIITKKQEKIVFKSFLIFFNHDMTNFLRTIFGIDKKYKAKIFLTLGYIQAIPDFTNFLKNFYVDKYLHEANKLFSSIRLLSNKFKRKYPEITFLILQFMA
jgi:hypothetical protein